jgi:aminopeptidase
VHLDLGSDAPAGERGQSVPGWSLVCDLRRGGRLSVDGEPIQVDGRFVGL